MPRGAKVHASSRGGLAMSLEDLLEPEVAARLANATAGCDEARHLSIDQLRPGVAGVLVVSVVHVEAPREFKRRSGGTGTLSRVRLADSTGEVDLVLWGDECEKVRDGTLAPGAAIVLRGAEVKEGWRGGLELGLGSAILEPLSPVPAGTVLEGVVVNIGATNIVGDGPAERFNADLHLDTPDGPVVVVLWDGLVPRARQLAPGTGVRLEGVARHPALDGWWVADGAALKATSDGQP